VSFSAVQEPGQAFSNHVVQAAVLFEHSCPITPGDFVKIHGNLDHGPVQFPDRGQELVQFFGWDAVRTPFSP